MPPPKGPSTNTRRVKGRIKVSTDQLTTIGQQLRAIREMRGMSKSELSRRMGVDLSTVGKIERKFIGRVNMRLINLYLEHVNATMICVPMPFPSFLDHEAIAYYPVESTIKAHNNLASDIKDNTKTS